MACPAKCCSDNGKQFTSRFGKPRPAEVLFERICRENGITQRLTKPRSPTTTGKIERLHQSLQLELLNDHEPFGTIGDAQAAVDAWRQEYNTDRPHQSLALAFPATRFTPATRDVLALRVPADLAPAWPAQPVSVQATTAARPGAEDRQPTTGPAVELDRIVPPSGNMWVAGQQLWLGPAMTGRVIRIWADTPAGARPSRRAPHQNAAVAARRQRPRPPGRQRRDPSRTPAAAPASWRVIEVERTVSASGNVTVGGHTISAGSPLAGQRVTLRLDGPVTHILASDGLVRTVACRVPPSARHRLRGARAGTAGPPRLPDPLTVKRRVSVRGAIMIGGQHIQVGLPHAGQTAEITVEADTYQITVPGRLTMTAPRTTSRDILRHKASDYPGDNGHGGRR